MEKDSLLNLFFLLIFCLVMGGFFVVYGLEEPEAVYTAPAIVSVPEIPDSILIYATGDSMEPWIPDGVYLRAYPTDIPVVGDVVTFECLVTRCVNSSDDSHVFNKFLRRIDSRGCYWFEGRTGDYMSDGKLVNSFDSSDYGYLCSGEFKVLGVVRDLPASR